MLSDAIAACELLVGLPDVNVLDVADVEERLRLLVETRGPRPGYPGCGSSVSVKDRHGRVDGSAVFRTSGGAGVAQDPVGM